MRHPDADDVARDALALVEAVHREDWEGAGAVAAHANLRLTAIMLARIAGDLLGNLADLHDADEETGLAGLRKIWTEP